MSLPQSQSALSMTDWSGSDEEMSVNASNHENNNGKDGNIDNGGDGDVNGRVHQTSHPRSPSQADVADEPVPKRRRLGKQEADDDDDDEDDERKMDEVDADGDAEMVDAAPSSFKAQFRRMLEELREVVDRVPEWHEKRRSQHASKKAYAEEEWEKHEPRIKKALEEMEQRRAVLALTGEPGAGKSYSLNQLVGNEVVVSGVAAGGGLTKVPWLVEHDQQGRSPSYTLVLVDEETFAHRVDGLLPAEAVNNSQDVVESVEARRARIHATHAELSAGLQRAGALEPQSSETDIQRVLDQHVFQGLFAANADVNEHPPLVALLVSHVLVTVPFAGALQSSECQMALLDLPGMPDGSPNPHVRALLQEYVRHACVSQRIVAVGVVLKGRSVSHKDLVPLVDAGVFDQSLRADEWGGVAPLPSIIELRPQTAGSLGELARMPPEKRSVDGRDFFDADCLRTDSNLNDYDQLLWRSALQAAFVFDMDAPAEAGGDAASPDPRRNPLAGVEGSPNRMAQFYNALRIAVETATRVVIPPDAQLEQRADLGVHEPFDSRRALHDRVHDAMLRRNEYVFANAASVVVLLLCVTRDWIKRARRGSSAAEPVPEPPQAVRDAVQLAERYGRSPEDMREVMVDMLDRAAARVFPSMPSHEALHEVLRDVETINNAVSEECLQCCARVEEALSDDSRLAAKFAAYRGALLVCNWASFSHLVQHPLHSLKAAISFVRQNFGQVRAGCARHCNVHVYDNAGGATELLRHLLEPGACQHPQSGHVHLAQALKQCTDAGEKRIGHLLLGIERHFSVPVAQAPSSSPNSCSEYASEITARIDKLKELVAMCERNGRASGEAGSEQLVNAVFRDVKRVEGFVLPQAGAEFGTLHDAYRAKVWNHSKPTFDFDGADGSGIPKLQPWPEADAVVEERSGQPALGLGDGNEPHVLALTLDRGNRKLRLSGTADALQHVRGRLDSVASGSLGGTTSLVPIFVVPRAFVSPTAPSSGSFAKPLLYLDLFAELVSGGDGVDGVDTAAPSAGSSFAAAAAAAASRAARDEGANPVGDGGGSSSAAAVAAAAAAAAGAAGSLLDLDNQRLDSFMVVLIPRSQLKWYRKVWFPKAGTSYRETACYVVVDDAYSLGLGRLLTMAELLARHFQLPFFHLMRDDLQLSELLNHEYVSHRTALPRALLFNERVMNHELNSSSKQQRAEFFDLSRMSTLPARMEIAMAATSLPDQQEQQRVQQLVTTTTTERQAEVQRILANPDTYYTKHPGCPVTARLKSLDAHARAAVMNVSTVNSSANNASDVRSKAQRPSKPTHKMVSARFELMLMSMDALKSGAGGGVFCHVEPTHFWSELESVEELQRKEDVYLKRKSLSRVVGSKVGAKFLMPPDGERREIARWDVHAKHFFPDFWFSAQMVKRGRSGPVSLMFLHSNAPRSRKSGSKKGSVKSKRSCA